MPGFFANIFGTDNPQAPNKQRREQVLSRLNQQAQGSPASTGFYRQGLGQLNEMTSQQQTRDASQLAARGMGGSEAAIARAASRSRNLGRGQRRLFQDASRQQQRSVGQLMAGMDQQDANYWRQRRDKQRRRAMTLNALTGALGTAATTAATGGMG